jgi:tRNA uridine 5-carboxymethylaminomethyl modification enzyme
VQEADLQVRGVRLQDGRELSCRAVVVTTGTFLNGLMHCGEQKTVGGRVNEPAATGLSDSLRELGLQLARLKTGTPPRVLKESVDLDRLKVQAGDDPPVPFSFMNDVIEQEQIVCWITHTNEQTHKIIRDNLDRAPMYSGQIKSSGPRYCPSIEDKVVRFADRPSHQLFLEPEGIDHPWIYCNGISTSLPRDVQEPLVHSIAGMEKAEIAQFGYAIEYDWVPTEQIGATLETKRISGLYLAGQINGTSGYEEAAAQGLMAGINAVLKLRDEESLVLGRDEAYIGVMIDDIVTRPPDEPYRMFTSRAEYRLHLRSDNADTRLTPIGRRIGLVDNRRWAAFENKRKAIDSFEAVLNTQRHEGRSLTEWLRRPEIDLPEIARRVGNLDLDHLPAVVRQAVQINTKYSGYLEREKRDIERFRQQEAKRIPESFDYTAVKDLRREAREKFGRLRPRSIGQAARISGISPADIATLSIYLMRHRKQGG